MAVVRTIRYICSIVFCQTGLVINVKRRTLNVLVPTLSSHVRIRLPIRITEQHIIPHCHGERVSGLKKGHGKRSFHNIV